MDPCTVNTAYDTESSFTMSPRSTARPLDFWYWGSNSDFLRWQRSNNEKMNFFFPYSLIHRSLLSCFWLWSAAMQEFAPNFQILSPLLPLASRIFSAWGIGMNLRTRLLQNSSLFFCDMILVMFVYCSFKPWSRAFVGINNTSIFCLAFSQFCGGVSPLLFIGILQRIAAGIGTSNFLRAALIVSLNSSPFGSVKNIPLKCLALSSSGFSIAHLCFAFFFAASDMCFHIFGHTLSGREGVCFLVSLTRDPCVPIRWPLGQKMNLVKPVHASDNSLSPSTFQ